MECTGPGVDRNGWITWTNIGVPTIICKASQSPSYVVFVLSRNWKRRCSDVESLSSVIETDNVEQYSALIITEFEEEAKCW